ncbi:MAG: STAS domain-containing protein [Planctomycetota bacterium JB042]
MSVPSSSDAGFRVSSEGNGAARSIELVDRALTFDVSESLKGRLREAVRADLEAGHRSFVLRLENVETVDSSGVGVLIALHHQVAEQGGALAVCGASPHVTKVLRIMKLDRFLTVLPDVERAVRAVSDPV